MTVVDAEEKGAKRVKLLRLLWREIGVLEKRRACAKEKAEAMVVANMQGAAT